MGSKGVRSAHSIDVWRLFAAFLVVCVHFPLPGMAGGIAITYAKTAVPFFIIVSPHPLPEHNAHILLPIV